MADALADFADFVADNWSRRSGGSQDDLRQLYIMSTGLAGETGEVLEHLKKHVRDGKLDIEALRDELGDVIHYWTRICLRYELSPREVMLANIDKIKARQSAREADPQPYDRYEDGYVLATTGMQGGVR